MLATIPKAAALAPPTLALIEEGEANLREGTTPVATEEEAVIITVAASIVADSSSQFPVVTKVEAWAASSRVVWEACSHILISEAV